MKYEVELFFSCTALKDLDGWGKGKSDPFVRVSVRDGKQLGAANVEWKSETI
jgi:hypothetical protein